MREKESETQAEGEAGPTQGAPHGTRTRNPRVTPCAEGCPKPLSHPGTPPLVFDQASGYHGRSERPLKLANKIYKIYKSFLLPFTSDVLPELMIDSCD